MLAQKKRKPRKRRQKKTETFETLKPFEQKGLLRCPQCECSVGHKNKLICLGFYFAPRRKQEIKCPHCSGILGVTCKEHEFQTTEEEDKGGPQLHIEYVLTFLRFYTPPPQPPTIAIDKCKVGLRQIEASIAHKEGKRKYFKGRKF